MADAEMIHALNAYANMRANGSERKKHFESTGSIYGRDALLEKLG